VSIDALRELCPAVMVFAVGAQGTKTLVLPGGKMRGIYSAKDFVYHQLPPFATQDFSTGRRVAIIGMGNVMVDIARWLLRDNPEHTTEEVVVVARRGPFEAKFDEKEFANIEMYLDRKAFQDELQRIHASVAAVGQDIAKIPDETFSCLLKYPQRQFVRP
jgi:ferredoxin/flavodoxin---NADP+ reductase